MVCCSVPECEVTRRNNPNQYTFHRFPRNPALREKWIRVVNRPDWNPSMNSTICSKHFDGKCFIQRKHRRVLMKDSIPTLYVSNLPVCKSINGSYVCTTVPSTSQHQLNVPSSTSLAIGPLPEAEVIIANVYQYLQSEFFHLKSLTFSSADLTPLGNILQRTAEATGVTQETVTAILEGRKRSSDIKADACQNKRAKLSQDFEDEDVSAAEEDKSAHEEDSADEDEQNEQEEELVETLKVEIDEEDEVPRNARGRKLWLVVEPLPTQPSASVQEPPPPSLTTPTAVVIKQEPIEDADPLTTCAVPLLLSSNHIPKSEPIDDDNQHTQHELPSTTQEEREKRPD